MSLFILYNFIYICAWNVLQILNVKIFLLLLTALVPAILWDTICKLEIFKSIKTFRNNAWKSHLLYLHFYLVQRLIFCRSPTIVLNYIPTVYKLRTNISHIHTENQRLIIQKIYCSLFYRLFHFESWRLTVDVVSYILSILVRIQKKK